MDRIEEYLAHAETCRTLAARTSDPERKAELLELAAKWSLLAEERQKLLDSKSRRQH